MSAPAPNPPPPAARPAAVLLDVGGVFHLPSHDRIAGAFDRAGFPVDPGVLDRAHYGGATAFVTDYEGELPWNELWEQYLHRYVAEAGCPAELRADAIEHLESEFATGGLWMRVVPGSREALRALAGTGVRLGVVSNADGLVAEQLRENEVLQVGPGPGVDVECVIDSGLVGVQKPDPRIFRIALDALGLEAHEVWYVGDMPGIDVVGARAAGLPVLVMDPFGFHVGADFPRVESLHDVAAAIAAAAPAGSHAGGAAQ